MLALAAALQAAPATRPAPPLIAPSPLPPAPPPLRVAPPAPPPPPPVGPARARSRANLASYVTGDDYPAEAIRNDEEGLVAFRLWVGANGRVVGCDIEQSSEAESLDEATCRIMQHRARFTPARGYRGEPVVDTVSARIRWQLAGDQPETQVDEEGGEAASERVRIVQRTRPVAPLNSYVSFRDFPAAARGQPAAATHFRLGVGADGQVAECEPIAAAAATPPALAEAACRLMRERARFRPARDARGNAIGDDYWGHIRWRDFESAPVPAPPPFPPR